MVSQAVPELVGRFRLGAGQVLTDGARVLRLIGCERDPDGGLVTLVECDDRVERVPFVQLCRESQWLTRHAPTGVPVVGDDTPEVAALPEAARVQVLCLARHLRQVRTGSPDGNPTRAMETPGGLDPRYDPRLVPVLHDRIKAKSQELRAAGWTGMTVSSLYRKLARLESQGVGGLLDRRWLRYDDPVTRADPQVSAAVGFVVASRVGAAQVSRRKLLALCRAELIGRGLDGAVSDHVLRGLLAELSRGRVLHRPARSQAVHTNRPPGEHSRLVASRPGELVQIDATPSDVHVWFPDLGWGPATILTGIDVYSRQILALRVVAGAVTTRDTSLLLWDMCRAEVTRGGWPRELRRWHGLPTLVNIDPDATRLSQEPSDALLELKSAVTPSMVVIDHGSEFDSAHFLSACSRNAIGVTFARPRTPTDKAIVESWHNTLGEALSAFPGYKGANPRNHPAGAEDAAAITAADLQDMLWTWILTVYHQRAHQGLRDLANPVIKVSPNLAFDRYLELGGHVEVATDPHRVISFLSCELRTVQDDGIHLHNRVFSNAEVAELRPQTQRGNGAKAKKIPVYYDRYDLTRIYLRHPVQARWMCVPAATPGGTAVAPFSEAINRAAIRDTRHGARPSSDEEILHREAVLLASWTAGVFADRKERRIHGLEQARQVAYARDIEAWGRDMRELAFPEPATADLPELTGYPTAADDDREVFVCDPDDVEGLAL